jgi:DNA-binding NtrC family response regulator
MQCTPAQITNLPDVPYAQTLFVISEDASLRELLTWFLRSEGYTRVVSIDGVERALHHLRLVVPELIILDPPAGGLEISVYSAAIGGPVPVLLLSSSAFASLPAHYHLMARPGEPEGLLEWIDARSIENAAAQRKLDEEPRSA